MIFKTKVTFANRRVFVCLFFFKSKFGRFYWVLSQTLNFCIFLFSYNNCRKCELLFVFLLYTMLRVPEWNRNLEIIVIVHISDIKEVCAFIPDGTNLQAIKLSSPICWPTNHNCTMKLPKQKVFRHSILMVGSNINTETFLENFAKM